MKTIGNFLIYILILVPFMVMVFLTSLYAIFISKNTLTSNYGI
jgi:hypothetical protein